MSIPAHHSATRPARSTLRAVFALALTLMLAVTGLSVPARAATVVELVGEWAAVPPPSVEAGTVLGARWWYNVNDDAAAPGNLPVDDITITFTAENALFESMPELCIGGGSPASSISPDRTTLLCNLGTRSQGTAEIVLPGITVHGVPGSFVGLTATVAGLTQSLTPILIAGDFRMDLQISGGSPRVEHVEGQQIAVFPWSLRHSGAEVGPSSVTYEVDVDFDPSGPSVVLPELGGAAIDGCIPNDRVHAAYPFSSLSHEPERTAAFPTCALTVAGATQLELTLDDLDYAGSVPVRDSRGVALPSDWRVIAAGEFRFALSPSVSLATIDVSVSAPTYTSTSSSATSVDDSSNNANRALILDGTYYGGWSLDWQNPPGIGMSWTDGVRSMAGERVLAASGVTKPVIGGTTEMCAVFDTRYVVWESSVVGTLDSVDDVANPIAGVEYEYYVLEAGEGGYLDPSDLTNYDPNQFRCNAVAPTPEDPHWVATPPSDPSTVRAVRVVASMEASVAAGMEDLVWLYNYLEIKSLADVPVGQDIWYWTSYRFETGSWTHPNRELDGYPGAPATLTPGLRYPFAFGGRDVLRTISALPTIDKTVDQQVAPVGATLDYTIVATPEAPLDATNPLMTVIDTLPDGMRYVAGSASPPPTGLDSSGPGDVLTWEFPNGDTNQPVTIFFSAELPDTAVPSTVYTNTATATIEDATQESSAETVVQTGGFTSLRKTVDDPLVAQVDGVAANTWTVTLESHDSTDQPFTDTIDVLPYLLDGRGTRFTGGYELSSPVSLSGMPAGAVAYYTTASPASIAEDPADPSNGQAGDPTGSSTAWSTTFNPNATAVRVIGPVLAASAVHSFTIAVVTQDASPQDRYVNRAHARAGNTVLIMRSSSAFAIDGANAVTVQKQVRDGAGAWQDADTTAGAPAIAAGATAEYRLIVTNVGDGVLRNLELTDSLVDLATLSPLPAGLGSGGSIPELRMGSANAVTIEYSMAIAASHVGGSVTNTACVASSEVELVVSCDSAIVSVPTAPAMAYTGRDGMLPWVLGGFAVALLVAGAAMITMRRRGT